MCSEEWFKPEEGFRAVEVDLRTASGEPVTEGTITAYNTDPFFGFFVFTQPAGGKFFLLPGDYGLSINVPGRPPVLKIVSVPVGTDTLAVDVALPALPDETTVFTWNIDVNLSGGDTRLVCRATVRIPFNKTGAPVPCIVSGARSLTTIEASVRATATQSHFSIYLQGTYSSGAENCEFNAGGGGSVKEGGSSYVVRSARLSGTFMCIETGEEEGTDNGATSGTYRAEAAKPASKRS